MTNDPSPAVGVGRDRLLEPLSQQQIDYLLFLIGVNGYAAWKHTVVGDPAPIVKEAFERMSEPQPGDLVLETSTVWRWMQSGISPGPALGILLRRVREPFPVVEGEEPATEEVFYLRPLDGSMPEYRWTNASFIALVGLQNARARSLGYMQDYPTSTEAVGASVIAQPPDLERWRSFYRALGWMLNDYIGVTDSVDYKELDKRLGYAHEGYHNARAVLRANRPPVPEGMQLGIRCKCWAKERGLNAGTRHEHYDEPPYGCARCECKAYDPAASDPFGVLSARSRERREDLGARGQPDVPLGVGIYREKPQRGCQCM